MRIHHHVSIILAVAIAGAIGLALTVGLFVKGHARDARLAGQAAERLAHVERLVAAARDVRTDIESLRAIAVAPVLDNARRELQRVAIDLSRVGSWKLAVAGGPAGRRRSAPAVEGVLTGARQTVERILRDVDRLRGTPALDPEIHLALAGAAADLVKAMEAIKGAAALDATALDEALARRQKLIMLVIGLICLGYLAVIERVRHWTTRRLVHPVQRLAYAAARAVEGEGFPGLDQGTTEELSTLARVLGSFVDTLKAKVRERTAEVERHRERLEQEVSVRRRAEDQLRHAAFHDKLTGLCNRDLLLDRLERCMQRARRNTEYDFAVLFLDIDRFKEVNDSLGHFSGDQLLMAISERLHQCLRSTDTLDRIESNTIARIGSDEFVVLLDGIKVRADAGVVAERIQEVIAEPFRVHGHEVFLTASIGIAFNELECEKADHLLRDADTAMYCAKEAGKARHEVFTKRMHDQAMARLTLGNDLRRAVEREEFIVEYQPIISLRSGRLTGFEALVRWMHPERGRVSPAQFIPRAEETGLIVPIGQWILERACRQLRQWQSEGAGSDLSVNVNVSKRQVAEPGLVETVVQVLDDTGIRGAQLKLEITESVIMENPDSIAEVLTRLKSIGVQIHMDDFGTGYSSLSYLHRFPLDVLKIDRAFMGTMSEDSDYADVIQTVVSMAHALEMEVTVEGVETREQLEQLRSLACDYAQGYYFAAPMAPEHARRILVSPPEWLRAA